MSTSGSEPVATSRTTSRARNQNAVLRVVHRQGPISRSDIAARLNLSPAAVTNLTSHLIRQGLLFEAREAETGHVGRRAVLLEVDYDRASVIGIKVSNTHLTCALTNLEADVLHLEASPLPGTDPETVADAVQAAFERLTQRDAPPVAALGINLPGIVDADGRTVRHSPLLDWSKVPFGDLLEDRLGISVWTENDANALALAEAWYGHGREHDDFLVVTLGRGVGLGLVLGGELHRGALGGAGEFGHVCMDPGGPETPHAAAGTLEAYVSDAALLREAHARVPSFPSEGTPEALVHRAEAGDEVAVTIYREAGEILGRALSMLVNVLAPPLIVLSGEGLRAAPYLLPATRAALGRHAFGDLADALTLELGTWGDDAWARGAASLAASQHLMSRASRTGGDVPLRSAP